MNKQDVFDFAARAVIKQGKPATQRIEGLGAHSSPFCAYKTKEGDRCAVGHLLPDNTPQAVFDAKMSVRELTSAFPEVKQLLGIETDEDVTFLARIQAAHDQYSSYVTSGDWDTTAWLKSFIDSMRDVAKLYELSDAILDISVDTLIIADVSRYYAKDESQIFFNEGYNLNGNPTAIFLIAQSLSDVNIPIETVTGIVGYFEQRPYDKPDRLYVMTNVGVPVGPQTVLHPIPNAYANIKLEIEYRLRDIGEVKDNKFVVTKEGFTDHFDDPIAQGLIKEYLALRLLPSEDLRVLVRRESDDHFYFALAGENELNADLRMIAVK